MLPARGPAVGQPWGRWGLEPVRRPPRVDQSHVVRPTGADRVECRRENRQRDTRSATGDGAAAGRLGQACPPLRRDPLRLGYLRGSKISWYLSTEDRNQTVQGVIRPVSCRRKGRRGGSAGVLCRISLLLWRLSSSVFRRLCPVCGMPPSVC